MSETATIAASADRAREADSSMNSHQQTARLWMAIGVLATVVLLLLAAEVAIHGMHLFTVRAPGFELVDGSGDRMGAMAIDAHGLPYVDLYDRQGEMRFALHMTEWGGLEVSAFGSQGELRGGLALNVRTTGLGVMSPPVSGEQTSIDLLAPASGFTGLGYMDRAGIPQLQLGAHVDRQEEPHLALRASDGTWCFVRADWASVEVPDATDSPAVSDQVR